MYVKIENIGPRAQYYQQKWSDLRNFQKKLENFESTILSERSEKFSSWCFGSASILRSKNIS
jgi:hypothetical protein